VNAESAEIQARLRAVREAKTAAYQRGEVLLPSADLDAVLPPVECLRTRLRESGLSYGEYQRRAIAEGRKP
jgi:hypothetical protein